MNTEANTASVCYNIYRQEAATAKSRSGYVPHHGGVKVSTGISRQDKRAEDGATSLNGSKKINANEEVALAA